MSTFRAPAGFSYRPKLIENTTVAEGFVTFEATGCEFVAPSIIKSSEICSWRTSSFLRVPFLCPLLGLFQLSWQRAPFSPTQIPKIEDYVMAWCIWICPILDSFFGGIYSSLKWEEAQLSHLCKFRVKELVLMAAVSFWKQNRIPMIFWMYSCSRRKM